MLSRTAGATVVAVGGAEVIAVGTELSGLPVAVVGWDTKEDFTTEEKVNVDDGILTAASDVAPLAPAVAVAELEPIATVDEGKKSNVGMELPPTADPADEAEALLGAAAGWVADWFPPTAVEPTGTVDEGWKSKAGIVPLAAAELPMAVAVG